MDFTHDNYQCVQQVLKIEDDFVDNKMVVEVETKIIDLPSSTHIKQEPDEGDINNLQNTYDYKDIGLFHEEINIKEEMHLEEININEEQDYVAAETASNIDKVCDSNDKLDKANDNFEFKTNIEFNKGNVGKFPLVVLTDVLSFRTSPMSPNSSKSTTSIESLAESKSDASSYALSDVDSDCSLQSIISSRNQKRKSTCKKNISKYVRKERCMKTGKTSTMYFVCCQCDKKFEDKQSLKRHIIRHGMPRFPCHKCGNTFIKGDLKKHMLVHEKNPELYQCDQCNKSYKRRKDLLKHVRRIHLKEKKFKCLKCNRKFFDNAGLKVHRKSKDHNF